VIRRAGLLSAVAVAAAIVLAGCSPAPEDGWRDQVSQAAEQASSGDYAAADATLATVEQAVAAARDDARIDDARAGEILAAVATVRADLSTLATPSPAPSESTSPVETTTPTPTPAETDEDEPAAPAPGNGNGNGNGNGKPGPKSDNGKGPADKGDDE
jgi:hypothetical protein